MTKSNRKSITIETVISASLDKAWEVWTTPMHIVKWNHASEDWHTTHATNDLKVGGKFNYRMEAKNGNVGFDFWGIYDEIHFHQIIRSTLGDDRKMEVRFFQEGSKIRVVESFEIEDENSEELQRKGWQAILDHFKSYTESLNN
ncbi:MAG: hypothetical protein FD133_1038 [Erysipelotrichaceae bacterium]|nr:MAG: hypothetical protein FD179_87 [Erysipelotrichaceae bacterium]TXT18202.1 MAG: hypothetical protein FD133_1038 [Erysipelotrichaceae bacterium]